MGAYLKIKTPQRFWATPVLSEISQVVATGSETNLSVDGFDVRRVTEQDTSEGYQIDYSIEHDDDPETDETVTYSSDNSSISTINSNGQTNVASTGEFNATITISKNGVNATHTIPLSVVYNAGIDFDYISPKSGSLSGKFDSDLRGLLTASNPTPQEASPRFSSRNFPTSVVRNEDFFLKGLTGLSSCGVWNSRGGSRRGAIAITPRHVLFAAHYPLYANDEIGFAEDTSGNVNLTKRTLLRTKIEPKYGGSSNGYVFDIGVGLLDSDLPSSIDTVKIPPSNFLDYLGAPEVLSIPMVYFDQEEEANTSLALRLTSRTVDGVEYPKAYFSFTATTFQNGLNYRISFFIPNYSSPSDRISYDPLSSSDLVEQYAFESLRSGDSGRQGFFIFNNEMILSHLHTAVFFGPNLSSMISEINQLIADVDSAEGVTTGYTVSTADFSAYPTY